MEVSWRAGGGLGHGGRGGGHDTSDPIPAAVAAASRADLILAKRVPPPADATDVEALAAAGWIDPHFPLAARCLRAIGWAAPSADR